MSIPTYSRTMWTRNTICHPLCIWISFPSAPRWPTSVCVLRLFISLHSTFSDRTETIIRIGTLVSTSLKNSLVSVTFFCLSWEELR